MSNYISAVDTAKLIRKALAVFKADYPNVKFSVRQSGSITWVDGPTEKEVKAIVGHFHGASYDGMYDIENSVYHTDENGNSVRYGISYLDYNRQYSIEFLQRAITAMGDHCYNNTGEKVTPDYEIRPASEWDGASIRVNGSYYAYANSQSFYHRWEMKVMEWAQNNSDTYDYEAEEARKRAEWEAEYEAKEALYAEVVEVPVVETVIIPVVIESDEPQVIEVTEPSPEISKHDLFHAKLIVPSWYNAPLTPKPSGEIDTPYGKAKLTVNDDYSVMFDVAGTHKIFNVLYKIQGIMRLHRDSESWVLYNHTMRVTGEWSSFNNGFKLVGSATDKASDKIKADLMPLIEAWLEKNYEKLSEGRKIGDINRIERARAKVISLQQELALRAKYLDIVECEFKDNGKLTDNDKRDLDVHDRFWRFG